MVDVQRRPRVARVQADRAPRRRFHREDGHAHLVTVRSRIEPREEEQVRQTGGAAAAGHRDGDLRHEQRMDALAGRDVVLQAVRALVPEADPDVIDQALADGQPTLRPEAAAQQDPR